MTVATQLTVEPVAGALGAVVTGIDLTRVREPEELADLSRALADHLVVFCPDQPLTLDDLERVTDLLGGRDVTPYVAPLEDRPYVIPGSGGPPGDRAPGPLPQPRLHHPFRGWSVPESQALLAHLYRHAVGENLTCRLRWARHTLAIWDNRCTQHFALNDYPGRRRELYRTSVKGAAPEAATAG